MAYPTYVQGAFGVGGATATVTLGVNTTPGNTLVFIGFSPAGSSGINYPDPGVGWTQIGVHSNYAGGGAYYQVMSVYIQTVGAGTNSYTFNAPGSSIGFEVILLECSPLDGINATFTASDNNAYTGPTDSSGPYTTPVATDVISIALEMGVLSLGNKVISTTSDPGGTHPVIIEAYDSGGTDYGSIAADIYQTPALNTAYSFTWQWTPVNGLNDISEAAFVTFPVAASIPSAPVLSGTAGANQNVLNWTTPANGGSAITDYSLFRGTSSEGESATPIYTALANTYTDTKLLLSKNRQLPVRGHAVRRGVRALLPGCGREGRR